jgi:hypothetical protein
MLRTEGYAWGPYLWRTTLDTDIISVILKRANGIRGDKSATPMLPFNFDDQWHFPSKDIDWFWGIFRPHLKKYLLSYSRHNQLPVPTEDDIWEFDHIWVNYYKEHDMTALHNHVGDLSIVLYLQIPTYTDKVLGTAPEPGSITFCWGGDKKTFVPKVGELFIFPSGLHHMVMPHRTEGAERVSLSANLYYRAPFNG